MYSFAVSSLSLATHMLLKHLNKSVFVRPGVRGGGSVWIECCVLSEISTVSTDGRACLCLLCVCVSSFPQVLPSHVGGGRKERRKEGKKEGLTPSKDPAITYIYRLYGSVVQGRKGLLS